MRAIASAGVMLFCSTRSRVMPTVPQKHTDAEVQFPSGNLLRFMAE